MLCHVGLGNPTSIFKLDRRNYSLDNGPYTHPAHDVVIVCKMRFARLASKDLVGIEIYIV